MTPLRLRAPREDGAVLALPDLQHWPLALEENRKRLATSGLLLGGMPLAELRQEARRELLAVADAYLKGTGQPAYHAPSLEAPWVVSGHQPELYHPGVWIKNFATAHLAAMLSGVGVHVIIDNDTIKRSSIAVPAGDPEAPVLAHVPFDRWKGELPYEEREVLDEKTFAAFGKRAQDSMVSYPWSPLLETYWPLVLDASRHTTNLGLRLSVGRRAVEMGMGIESCEAPLAALAETLSFRLLVSELLLRADSFANIHNDCLVEYRRANKIRSRNHPVPALEKGTKGTELPLWAWTSENPRRQRVFVKTEQNRLFLQAESESIATLPCSPGVSPADLAKGLTGELGKWKLRPRALVTTIYLRLLIADLFVHGIGGGKYDELTDLILGRFFEIEPPTFSVLTATLLLPRSHQSANGTSLAALVRRERDLTWNPDRYIDEALRDQDPIAGWIEQKYELHEQEPQSRAERHERFRAYRALNDKLRKYLGRLPETVRAQIHRTSDQVESHSLLDSREFAFCLHPEDALRRLFARVEW